MVRLNFRNRVSATLTSEHADAADGTEHTLTTRGSSALSIKVRGELNADELVAIQDTIDQAMDLADDLFAGNIQDAFNSVAAFGIDGEQLARVQLKLRTKERLTYSPSDVGALPGASARGESAATPREIPGTNQAREGDPAPSGPAVGSPTDAQSPDANPDQAQRMGRFNAMQAAGDFLGRLLDALGANDGEEQASSLDLSLKIRIVRSTIVTLAEAAQEEEMLAPLLPDTLDALASQEQAPVDQLA